MMTKDKLTERFNEIMSFDHQTPVEDMELKYICSNLGAIAEIEKLQVDGMNKEFGDHSECHCGLENKTDNPILVEIADVIKINIFIGSHKYPTWAEDRQREIYQSAKEILWKIQERIPAETEIHRHWNEFLTYKAEGRNEAITEFRQSLGLKGEDIK